MKELKLAILGATGAVGREMLLLLEEYQIPVKELRLLSGKKSAGTTLPFCGKNIVVEEATEDSFKGLDYVLGAAENAISLHFAPAIQRSGAVYIDNSSAFRADPVVPLVIPEINGEDAKRHQGIIANPNCSTVIALMAAAPLHALSPIRSMVASTYQAVSGAGAEGQRELHEELIAYALETRRDPVVFPVPIAMNVIPNIGARTANDYTDEEMKMQNEGRRILHLPELRVSCTCVRVPVLRSHSISLNLWTQEKISVAEAADAISKFPGCRLITDSVRDYPTPLDAAGQDTILVGRLREDLMQENGLALWCCGDQIRKGAAANALQILQYLER